MIIEIKDKTYQLPEQWLDITIGKLQELTNIDENLDEIDKTLQIINVLSGIPTEDLLELPFTQYKKLTEIIEFVKSEITDELFKSFTFDGIEYIFQCELNEMSTGEYIDLDSLIKDNDPDNLHLLMAIMYRPKDSKYDSKEVRKRSLIFQENMPVAYVIGAQVFFQVFDQTLSQHLVDSSAQELNQNQ